MFSVLITYMEWYESSWEKDHDLLCPASSTIEIKSPSQLLKIGL